MNITYKERASWYDIESTLLDDQHFLKTLLTGDTVSILEIPCGSGRNIPWFMEAGKSITLVDQCAEMVQICVEKMKGYEGESQVVVSDMRDLSLSSPQDLILVPQDSFLLLETRKDMERALCRFENCLSSSGRLMIDMPLLDNRGEISSLPRYYSPNLPDGIEICEWVRDLPNGKKLRRFRTQHHLPEHVRFDFRYELFLSDESLYGRYVAETLLRRISKKEIESLVRQTGFSIKTSYRNYRKELLTEDASRAILILARQKE